MWEELLDWYDKNGRELPWRVRGGFPAAYGVWVSEVMLQQTRAEAVIPYYARFMAALPDIAALAAAETDTLYKLWEGLGYYSRVRNLRAAAQETVQRFGGALPADYDALRSLPGIGDYTAGAIASIAFGIPVPAVDGNVLRVFARLYGDARDIQAPDTRRDIRALAAQSLPADRPGDFNQALMDLGAGICIPGRPRCGGCPLRTRCRGFADGTAALLPNRAPKRQRRIERRTVLVLRCGNRAALARRGPKGVLAGQWELPGFGSWLTPEEIAAALGPALLELEPLPDAVHVFTHLEWHMKAYRAELSAETAAYTWFDAGEIEANTALPSAFRAYRAALTAPRAPIRPSIIQNPPSKNNTSNDKRRSTMKFSEMPYTRVTLEEVEQASKDFIAAFTGAADAAAAEAALRAFFAESLKADTNMSLAFTRHSIDTKDEFYSGEIDYYDEQGPVMQLHIQKANDAVLDSRWRAELEKSIGNLFFRKLENEKKCFSEAIIPELQEENKLTTEYGKLLGGAELEFDGNKLNLSQMQPYRTSSDRDVRRRANATYFGWFEAYHEDLDRIYDALVKTRTAMAKKLGFDNYIPLGYLRMERMDYDAGMVKVYRDEVKKYLSPLVTKINERQRKRLGLDDFFYYDIDYQFPTGNPHPIGTPEELVEKARAMYAQLSPETKEFFDFMTENELMDLVAKPGKETGGYCTAFPDYKAPFIFSNFNGTKDDVDVLTHEAGHALQMYLSMRGIDIPAYLSPTYESCEIHSMSMELITAPYMEPFFGDETEKFRYMQLVDILRFIPYGCLVDDFQHEMYANPDMTPDERLAKWRELEKQYMPDLTYDMDYLERGGRWQRQSHIFERPFYYIDYTLAQVCAMQFYIRFDTHDPDAWKDYLNLCGLGGSKTFLGLVEAGGLQSPFKPGVMQKAVDYFEKKLGTFDDSKF